MCDNLRHALEKDGDDTGTSRVLLQGLTVQQNVEKTVMMDIKYSHLPQDCTVTHTMWLVMFRLVRRLPHKLTRDHTTVTPDRVSDKSASLEVSQHGHQDDLKELWKWPYHCVTYSCFKSEKTIIFSRFEFPN